MGYIDKIIREEIEKVVKKNTLCEAKQDVKFRDFNYEMKKLGFTYEEGGRGSAKIYFIPSADESYRKESKVTVHVHGTNGNVKASSLVHVKETLKKIGWFKDKNNFDKFPFEKWGLPREDVMSYDTTENDIKASNENFEDVEITPVFQMKDSICIIKTEEGYNLCRSTMDRRPLEDRWYDECVYNQELGTYCLKYDDYDRMETISYPITQNGLDKSYPIIENRNRRKKRLF